MAKACCLHVLRTSASVGVESRYLNPDDILVDYAKMEGEEITTNVDKLELVLPTLQKPDVARYASISPIVHRVVCCWVLLDVAGKYSTMTVPGGQCKSCRGWPMRIGRFLSGPRTGRGPALT